jgi:2-amino-4-hydroxy-6-hydroxymethyldihydropteridine diphosphokinase
MGLKRQINKPIALALGSNIGNRMEALRAAVAGLKAFVTVTKISPVYETAAAYVADQPPFLNAALLGETSLEPLELLHKLKTLETELGRQPSFRYGPRLVDIDILFYGDRVLASPELAIPHPRMAERAFVLKPLADIAPDMKHPETGLSVAEMLAQLPDSEASCLGDLL